MAELDRLLQDLAGVREACDREDWTLADERLSRHQRHVLQALQRRSIRQDEAQHLLQEQNRLGDELRQLQATAAAELGLLQRSRRASRAYRGQTN